ncbi:MAG TPA: 5-methyltetrahydropteroyltriglutamate--homocysteine S-methyltransferase [Treponemataceae bacterium]|jgi:5-methyltetrahydropteroyltriglutamate--homocysteine methyltransferase|nr:MAG: 5-methyltetrahydropteroyltriglutamate--homocysteine methyltransferase [Spirochaetes bacterium ADurb.Bin215]HOF85383.1 5-methyltetrahydropteroyltriglutamate--homocysteine S-methyltransferase [Treponemataceae bacterium]HOS36356.1 5-methyltetrahydropteroyltriglutamate--homocysteine S-methyltransferase [Treponemataceae bacterium]HOU38862.1 5-methyltetrahydropteroyltriglutamate--homocysteine S-methyltransferase [Treponemataceae bacterium]HPA09203.1 5-methyltetrahydropteroyltriglutamate--homo
MKTAVAGFPRIGAHRELKFATEKWFRKEVSDAELFAAGKKIRLENWQLMKTRGITSIPSNDFSFYDSMLDTAVLLGAIPERFRTAPLSDLERYFALARGHQSGDVDLHALTMTKWFNTNYHYIIPELEDDMVFTLQNDKPFNEYREALEAGIQTRPVFIGPFTFLHLARYTGNKHRDGFAPAITSVWKDILERCAAEGIPEIQIDEPALVTDLSPEDRAFFTLLYRTILDTTGGVRIHLHTAYGDVRDAWQEILALPFDSIGLDLLEGKKNLALLSSSDFPQDKELTIGVINGKNVWRAEPSATRALMAAAAQASGLPESRITIAPSCTLLHVPVSLEAETALDETLLKRLSFATEKLDELTTLAGQGTAGNNGGPSSSSALKDTPVSSEQTSSTPPRQSQDTSDECTRLPPRQERSVIQQRRFTFPYLPATTIGSFPQTAEVRENRARLRRGEIDRETYEQNIQAMIRQIIAFQESIGLDALVYGEFERNDMVEFFGENLAGFAFTRNGWVQSYGTRCVKPPIIHDDVSRIQAMTVDLAVYAQSLTPKPVKGMLTGPVTILNWSFPREDIPHRDIAFQIGRAIREEVLDLEQHGISIIQIDEAAFKEKLPLRRADRETEYLDWAIRAFRLAHSGVRPETQIHTHMCYSDFTGIIDEIDALDADVISFEASRSNLSILDTLAEHEFKTAVGPGVYDIHSPRIPPREELEAVIRTMIEKLGITTDTAHRLWINPDCGLKTRGTAETEESLANMMAATRKIRSELSCDN